MRLRAGMRCVLHCALLLAVLLSQGCAGRPATSRADDVATERAQRLWSATVAQYLDQPLWLDAEAYDACNYLMIPLHSAFAEGNPLWTGEFHDHFASYRSAGFAQSYSSSLNEIQYLALAGRYVLLATMYGQGDRVPEGLDAHILRRVTELWTTDLCTTWGQPPFRGMQDRLSYKLAQRGPVKGYFRAVTDEELLLFAIAGDLSAARVLRGESASPVLGEILDAAYRVLSTEVRWTEGTWLLQPGVWSDHPDYAQAGREAVPPGGVGILEPSPVKGIAADTSHSHRLPFVLDSLLRASRIERERTLYARLMSGLEQRMFALVFVRPDPVYSAWRTTNYLDGRNGVYRWEYPSQGPGTGYLPYQLSGTLNLGWWALMRTQRTRSVYQDQAEAYPMSENMLKMYVGPNTTRARNPLVSLPSAYTNGFMELIAILASRPL